MPQRSKALPTIPGDFVQSVMPRGALAPQQIQANPADFGAQVGQTLQKSGNELMRQAVAQQQFQNETVVNDVINNKFFPAFQDRYQKYYALQGKDAVDQLGAYQQGMRDLVSNYRDSFSSPAQQRLFDQQVTRRIQYELGGMGRYADQQNKVWQAQTSQASVQREIGSAADKYNDQNMLYGGVMATANEIAKYGAMAGQGEDIIRLRRQSAWDKLYSTVIQRQALDPAMGPEAANGTFQDGVNRGFISGSAQLNIARYLRPMLQVADAQRAYGQATGHGLASRIANAASSAGLDASTALTIATIESGLDPAAQNPDSSAHGLFQHLDSTWRQLGGTPENRNDPDAQIAAGIKGLKADRDQLAAALKRQPQPWELYLAHQQGVAGAANLLGADQNSRAADVVGDKAVTQNGGAPDTTVGQYLATTQNLFARKSTHFTDQGVPTAQNIRENYDGGLDAMSALAEREHPGDPAALARYRNFFIQQAGQALNAQQSSEQANRETCAQGLHGAAGAKSWTDFLADPSRATAYAALSGEGAGIFDLVDNAIKANALESWDPSPTVETQALHDNLNGMKTTDRTRFENTDLMTHYGQMPVGQLNQLMKDQALMREHDAGIAQKQESLIHALSVAGTVLAQAGFSPGSSSDSGGAEEYNTAVGRYSRAIDVWRSNNAEKLPDDWMLLDIARKTFLPPPASPNGAVAEPALPSAEAAAASLDGEHIKNFPSESDNADPGIKDNEGVNSKDG
jgi:hypothetical protein